MEAKKLDYQETSVPLWSYLTISLVVGYLNEEVGQGRSDHFWCRYFWSGWGTIYSLNVVPVVVPFCCSYWSQ